MAMKYEFSAKQPSWSMNIDDLFQTTIVSGDEDLTPSSSSTCNETV